MAEIAGSEDIYSKKWLKMKVQERYGNHVLFTEIAGKSNVVCLRDTAHFLINDSWVQKPKGRC